MTRRGTAALRAPLTGGLSLLFAAVAGPGPAAAQDDEVRVLAVVDYVAGTELYLAAGTDHALRAGDTLSVYDSEGAEAELLGLLAIVSANERRSVATTVGAPFRVERGDVVYLAIPAALARARTLPVREEPSVAAAGSAANDASRGTGASGDSGFGKRPPLQVNGRVSIDMDAYQTTTRWGSSPGEESTRTFSTPTLRIQGRARNLPGGFHLGTSMRLSHRTSPDELIQPATSLRFYELDLEKEFEAVPLQLHLGRFHHPFDDFSGYWDGIMAHLGAGALGAGVAVGYEPEYWDEGFTTDRPKLSGFVDLNLDGPVAEYSGALSFQTIRPSTDNPDRTYLGLSQRLRLGGAWIRNRVQLDRSGEGVEWTLTRFQLDASLPLAEGLSAHGGWRRWRPYDPLLASDLPGLRHDRGSMGLSYWAAEGGLSADVSLDRPEGEAQSRTLSSSFFLRRIPALGVGLSGTASYWTQGASSSILVSPEVRLNLGRGDLRGGYRYYRLSGEFGDLLVHYGDLALTFSLGGGVSARVQGFVQWGEDLAANRILASLWKSF